MKRYLLCTLLAAAAMTVSAQAAQTVPVQMDGTLLSPSGQLEQGTTYLPLRSLLEAMGGWTLAWDTSQGKAVAKNGSRVMTADPSAGLITLDGRAYSGHVYLLGGRTYVPLRTTAEACGAQVRWDSYLGGAAVTGADAVFRAEDLYWLSRIISAESRGEPLEGQIAVGNVVLNRAASPEFPDSIPGVIFDRTDGVQFEPVSNGTIYQSPTASAQEAARRVLSGERSVDGCLYFYAPALSQGLWINANRTYVQTIGCHRFYL